VSLAVFAGERVQAEEREESLVEEGGRLLFHGIVFVVHQRLVLQLWLVEQEQWMLSE